MTDPNSAGESPALTARDVLGAEPGTLTSVLRDVITEDDITESEPRGSGRLGSDFVIAQAALALDQILGEVELGKILMSGWDTLDEVRAAIDETGRDRTTQAVTMASHTVTSEHAPTIELVVNQAPRKLLDLTISLGLVLDACELVVSNGTVQKAQVGSMRASGEVNAHGRTILSKAGSDLDPKRLFTRSL